MPPRLWVTVRMVIVSTLSAVMLGGCGSSPSGETAEVNVSVQPAPFCNAVAQRRRLGAAIPDMPFPLALTDVDDFSGETDDACNLRVISYLRTDGSLDGPHPSLLVRLFFTDDARMTMRLESPPHGHVRGHENEAGTDLELYAGTGLFGARFALGDAVVDVIAACARPQTPGRIAPCQSATSARALRDRTLDSVRRLLPPLRTALA